MRSMLWVLLAPLACGCGRVAFDQLDDAGAPSGDTDGNSDSDGDGVSDTSDNCPSIANAAQDNEDGDDFGDACDTCPPFVDNTDPDGDGVGGDCDPNPTVGGDRISFFDGFGPASTAFTMTQIEAAWVLGSNHVHVNGALTVIATITLPVTGNSETVSTHVRIDELFGTNVSRLVGLVHERNQATNDGMLCAFGIDASNSEVYALADEASDTAYGILPTAANVGDETVLSSTRVGTSYHCPGPTLASSFSASNTLVSPENRVGLFVRNASATFDWMMVVTSP